jgi:hypothetical protein
MVIESQTVSLLIYWIGGLLAVLIGWLARRKRGHQVHDFLLDFSNGITIVFLSILIPAALWSMTTGGILTVRLNGTDSAVLFFAMLRALAWCFNQIKK